MIKTTTFLAAALLTTAAAAPSFAQQIGGQGSGEGRAGAPAAQAAPGGGAAVSRSAGGRVSTGSGPGPSQQLRAGGNVNAGGTSEFRGQMSTGSNFRASQTTQTTAPAPQPVASGSTRDGQSSWSGQRSGGWNNNNWNNNWSGRWNHDGDWGHRRHYRSGPSFSLGIGVGPSYYGSYAYNDYPYDDDAYAYYGNETYVGASAGSDHAYCTQRYRSYDPASGTYLGFDGLRHPCP